MNQGISKRQTWLNGLNIMSASTLSQVVGVVCYPVVARLYSPDDVGALSVLLAVVGIFATIACGRYEQATMVEPSPRDARSIWHLCFALCSTLSLVLAVLYFVLGKENIAHLLATPEIATISWLIAPLVWLSSVGYALSFVFNSINRFSLTSRYTICQGVGNNLLKIAFAPIAGGLAFASVAGQCLGIASVAKHFPSFRHFSFSRLRRVAVRHWRFPVFNMPHALIGAVANNLPVLILAHTFPPAAVGVFALCISFGYKPVNVFSLSLNQAFFHSAGQNHSFEKPYARMLRVFVLKCLLIVLPLAAGLFWAMPLLVDALFGERWLDAAPILCALLPLFVMSILSTSLSFVPLMLRKQATAMFIEVASAVCRTVVIVYASLHFDIVTTTWIYALTHSFFLLVQLVWYLKLIWKEE